MANIRNLGSPSIIGRGFVPLAAECGLTLAIRLMTGPCGMDRRSLLIALKESLYESNQELSDALNIDNLIFYLVQNQNGNGHVVMLSIPTYSPTIPRFSAMLAGPAEVDAEIDPNPNRFTVMYSEPPTNDLAWDDGKIHVEVYYDGMYATEREFAWVDGEQTNEQTINTGAAIIGTHKVRVLFLRQDDIETGQVTQSRFGPIAEFTV